MYSGGHDPPGGVVSAGRTDSHSRTEPWALTRPFGSPFAPVVSVRVVFATPSGPFRRSLTLLFIEFQLLMFQMLNKAQIARVGGAQRDPNGSAGAVARRASRRRPEGVQNTSQYPVRVLRPRVGAAPAPGNRRHSVTMQRSQHILTFDSAHRRELELQFYFIEAGQQFNTI